MSKAVRIRDHLYEEIERLAKQERRSIISQLEVLLEQALRLESGGFARIMDGDEPVGVVIPPIIDSSDSGVGTANAPGEAMRPHIMAKDPGPESSDAHFKPDFKGGK